MAAVYGSILEGVKLAQCGSKGLQLVGYKSGIRSPEAPIRLFGAWKESALNPPFNLDSSVKAQGTCMHPVASQFPAVMVLREKGEILFLDRRACELTGYGFGEHQDLQALLASLFPESLDQLRATRLFRRAAATAGRQGAARFQAEFPSKHGRRRQTIVQVQRWDQEQGERSYLVSLLPSESRSASTAQPLPAGDRAAVMQAVARRVVRLLQGAADCSHGLAMEGDPADERFAVLSALIERAQGLLGSLESQGPDGPMQEGEGKA